MLSLAAVVTGACALGSSAPVRSADVPAARLQLIKRAQVWLPTRVSAMNFREGPTGAGSFRPGATVTCEYVQEKLSGGTPKFSCARTDDDKMKVKYGEANGEVFAEVAASRLLWALGFPADAQYPVRVICRGCSVDPWTNPDRVKGETVFEYAAIERKHPSRELTPDKEEGWAWPELDLVDEEAGGAPRRHRDALKLLAVFLQHTDTKPQQQRLACRDRGGDDDDRCGRPLMMINDLGLTFGRANTFNRNTPGSVNLDAWSDAPIWRDPAKCVGYLPKSLTGTLEHPPITEAGRAFLANLLAQLSDVQIRDLFEVSRVEQRAGAGERRPSVDEWVRVFKNKRADIVNHSCRPSDPDRARTVTH